MKKLSLGVLLILATATAREVAQTRSFVPVTQQMLANPSPDDWLMFSRTYDAQRFSPLTQITRQNVGQLRMTWTRGMLPGQQETIPIVYKGVMYLAVPGAAVQALDATTGDLIWEYKRPLDNPTLGTLQRIKSLAIYDDVVLYTAPDSYVVGLDARTGQMRWQTKAEQRGHNNGAIVVDGKVITSGSCANHVSCFVSAHDVKTGKELWRFYSAAGADDPGNASWGGTPVEKRVASLWGLPGSYDPVRRLIYWGVANPTPYTRRERHGGNPDAIPKSAPADLYSDSTLALNPDTGKLVWYYQHLPGDDWDLDGNEERILIRTPFNPDPRFVKWINPTIPRGEMHDVTVNITEGGGIWTLDRSAGKFLWATPFPFDTPQFYLSKIDPETGKTFINTEMMVSTAPGTRSTVCFYNTKSYWAAAYHPGKNALYAPYMDDCLDMTSATPATETEPAKPEHRMGGLRVGADVKNINGLAKINMATGEIQRWHTSQIPSQGAVLATAGDLIFWGDLNRRFRAFDADSGKVLWESILGGQITTSTITYAVNGKQYVAVLTGTTITGEGLTYGPTGPEGATERDRNNQALTTAPIRVPIHPGFGHNAIYVFALP